MLIVVVSFSGVTQWSIRMTEVEYIPKSILRERGWTEKAISTFYPKCEKEVPNPRFPKKAAPMKLYSLEKVEIVEQSSEFKEFQQGSSARKNAARKAVETKKKNLLAEVATWKIEVKEVPLDIVRKEAIKSYNGWNYENEKYASLKDDPQFLDRITVNYLRHELSNYDERLKDLFKKVGKQEGYRITKKKILTSIAECYPELADEAERQMKDPREQIMGSPLFRVVRS
jgi:hypothetical protein